MDELMFQQQDKRPRSYNWSAQEKEILHKLASQHVDIIDCKDNSTPMIDKKNEIWNLIQKQMSSMGFYHEARRLKQQWVRIKQTNKNQAYKNAYEMTSLDEASCPMPNPSVSYTPVPDMQTYYSSSLMIPDITIKEEQTEIPTKEFLEPLEDASSCSTIPQNNEESSPLPAKIPRSEISNILMRKRLNRIEKQMVYDTELQRVKLDLEKAKLKVEEKRLELMDIQIKYAKLKEEAIRTSITNGM